MAKIMQIGNKMLSNKLKIKKGDDVIEFNNKPFFDVLDYLFYDSKDKFSVTVLRNGKPEVVKIVKDEDESLEWEFDESLDIIPYICHNDCIFCFVKQLPQNLRETLYIKDDDYRTSFINGSYITCTNLKDYEIERIINYKLSPIYISVHSTDYALRNYILGIKKSLDIMQLMKKFVDKGIKIHTQIVMVEGVNDGDQLLKSLKDLKSLGENLCSVAVVPVGLTNHRDGLCKIEKITKGCANLTIDVVEKFYKEEKEFCYAADEMYQIAERDVPPAEYYQEFEQIENGVGLISKFLQDVKEELEFVPHIAKHNKSLALITGVAGFNSIEKAVKLVKSQVKGLNVNIYRIVNNFFGDNVTVSGLITASDIIKAIDGKNIEDVVVIPNVMLREFEEVFLDDMTVEALSKKLNRKIIVSGSDGSSFVNTLIFGE